MGRNFVSLLGVLLSAVLLAGSAIAGSTYSHSIDNSSEWSNGFNLYNTTVTSGQLATPRTTITFSESGSGWTSYKSNTGFDVGNGGINQSRSYIAKTISDSDTFYDVGGVADWTTNGQGEANLAVDASGLEALSWDGSLKENDVLTIDEVRPIYSNAETTHSRYIESNSSNPDSTTISCSNEHTWEWSTTVDSSNNEAGFRIDGIEEIISEGQSLIQGDHSGYPSSDCGDTGDDQSVYLLQTYSTGEAIWLPGFESPDIAAINGSQTGFYLKNAPLHEAVWHGGGGEHPGPVDPSFYNVPNQDNLDSIAIEKNSQSSTYVAVNINDNDLGIYQADSGGSHSISQKASFTGHVRNARNTIGTAGGDLDGDGVDDFITATSGGDLGYADLDDSATATISAGTVTGVGYNSGDVDGDSRLEIALVIDGFIHHAEPGDYANPGVEDLTNTSIYAYENDVGEIWDIDKDSVAEIPYRDQNRHVNYVDYTVSTSGEYKADTKTGPAYDPLNLTISHSINSDTNASTYLDETFSSSYHPLLTSYNYRTYGLVNDNTVTSTTVVFNYTSTASAKSSVSNWTLKGERYPLDAAWNSTVVDAADTDPTPGSMGVKALPVNVTTTGSVPDTTYDHNYTVKLASDTGSWTSFRPVLNVSQDVVSGKTVSRDLSAASLGRRFALQTVLRKSTAGVGNTSRIDELNLSYVYPSVPTELNAYNESIDVSYVQAGYTAKLRARVVDSDGDSDITSPTFTVSLPNGSVFNSSADSELSTSKDGKLYQETVHVEAAPGNVGSASFNVSADDGTATVYNKTGFQVKDTIAPRLRNQTQSHDKVGGAQVNNLSAEVFDAVQVDQAYLWTNETGEFQRKSGVYNSPITVGQGDTYVETTFNWSNMSVARDTAVGWKIQYMDSEGNQRNTSIKSFRVTQPIYINDVEIQISNIGNTESFYGQAFLTGESQISDHKPISADTVSFTDSLWEFDNFTAPFSDDLRVNDTNGALSTNYTVDFDTTDHGLSPATGEPANLSRQVVERIYQLTNTGDKVKYNLSFVDEGTPVAGTDTAVNVSAESTVNHSAKWSNDHLNHSLFTFRIPTTEVILDQKYRGAKPVQIQEKGEYSWTSVNVNGSMNPPTVCTQANGTSLSVSASTTVNRSVGFNCNPGTAGTPVLNTYTADDVEHFNYTSNLTVVSELTSEKRITWRINETNLNKWKTRNAGSAVATVNGSKYDIEVVDGSGYVDITVQTDFSNSSLHKDVYSAWLHYTKGSSSGGSDGGGTGGSGGGGTVILPDEDRSITFTSTAWPVGPSSTRTQQMKIRNHFNENVSVELTIPPQQQDNDCQYFRVEKQKGIGLTSIDGFGKQGRYSLPPKSSGDNFGRYSDMWVGVEVTMPDDQTEVLTCEPEVNASSGYAEDLVLKARPKLRLGERIEQFFAGFGIPDTQIGLFEDICLNTRRNTAENAEQLPCSERDQSTVPFSWAAAAGLAVAVVAVLVLATWGRMVYKVLRVIMPF